MKGLLFTYLLTYGGVFASLVRPFYGLLVYVAFSILKPEALWHWSVPVGNYSRLVALGLLAGWVLSGFGNWSLGRARPVILFLMGFWVLGCISATTAYDAEKAWGTIEALSKVFLPAVIGITLINSVRQLKQLAWVIILCQGYLAFEFNLIYFSGGYNPNEFQHAQLDNNSYAILMDTVLGVSFFLGLHSPKLWQKLVVLGFAAFMAHFVFFSMSRGGVLALMAVGLICFYLLPKQPRHFVIFFLFLLVAARMAGPSVWDRFFSTIREEETLDRSAQSRLEYWAGCQQAMAENPLLGVGPGCWPLVTPQYGIKLGRAAHSTWYQVGAEFGVPALVCLVMFFFSSVWLLWPLARYRERAQDPWLAYIACMVIAAIVGYMVSAQFVTLYGVDVPYFVGLLGAGALKLASSSAAHATSAGILSAAPPLEAGVAVPHAVVA